MIVTGLLYIIYAFASVLFFPLSLLGDVSLDPNIASAVSTAGSYYALADQVLPMSSILAVFTIILTVELAIFIYKSIMFILRKIPGIS